MIINVWTFLFELVNFLVLVYVLNRLLYRPIHDAIDRRRTLNEQANTQAEHARAEATALQEQLKARMASIEQERGDTIRKARDQAETERKEILAKAEESAQRRLDSVKSQLEHQETEAKQSLRAEMIQSALDVAERLLREAANTTLERQLAARLLEDLGSMSEEERQRIRAELDTHDGAVLEAAHTPEDSTRHDLATALTSLVGREVTLSVNIKPELVSGLCLRMGGHVWDASLKGALEMATTNERTSVTA